MPQLIILILLIFFLWFYLNRSLESKFLNLYAEYNNKRTKYENAENELLRIEKENLSSEEKSRELFTFYDNAKEICKTLDEERIFNIFRDTLEEFTGARECRFLKYKNELIDYQKYDIFPVNIDSINAGYLVVGHIPQEDKDKFSVLMHQFMAGIKRAFLYGKVQESIIIDGLTQAFSRRHFLERFSEELQRTRKNRSNLSFLMADIDFFKSINDNYGHLVGDAILREVSHTIKESIRQIDFMGRFGGEELSVLLPETDKARAINAAERIREAVESREFKVYDEKLKVTISIGISTFPQDADTANSIIDKADHALYIAKQGGRNKVSAYGSDK